jgi:hypothetical protein
LAAIGVLFIWSEIRNGFSSEVAKIKKSVDKIIILTVSFFCFLTPSIVYITIFNISNVKDDFKKIYFEGRKFNI